MKQFATLTAAAALLSGVTAASAADIYNAGGSSKDAPVVAGINWSGVYIQIGAGGAFANADARGTGTVGSEATTIYGGGNLGLSGFAGDIRVGYDYTLGKGLLIGLWGEVSDEVASGSNTTGSKSESQYGYGAGLRAGRYFGTSLVYGLVGWQGLHVKTSGSGWSLSNDLNGIGVGGGIEAEIAQHVTLGAEAKYIAYGDWTPANGLTVSGDEVRTTARLGYRF